MTKAKGWTWRVVCGGLLMSAALQAGTAQDKPTPTPTPAEEAAPKGTTVDAWRKALPAVSEQPADIVPAVPSSEASEETPEMSEKRLTELEGRWLAALQSNDLETLRGILADDFTTPALQTPASLTNKTKYLAQFTPTPNANTQPFANYRLERWRVRLYGALAVVHVWLQPPSTNNNQPVSLLCTDVWQRRGTVWQAITRQCSS